MVWVQTNFTAGSMNTGKVETPVVPVVAKAEPVAKKKPKAEPVVAEVVVEAPAVEVEEVVLAEPEVAEPEVVAPEAE